MVKSVDNGAAAGSERFHLLPVLLLLLVGSGGCALIYEIIWFQLLELVIGSSAISLGVLLATYMGGLCIGSLLYPRKVSPRHHPLRVYAFLEFGIGAFGLLVLLLLPLVSGVWSASGGHGLGSILLRALLSAICLLPPTILMGATLPAVSRWLESSREGVAWIGFLYAGNTVGAVVGAVLAGFYFLRVFDLTISTFIAVAINAIVGGVAFLLSQSTAGGSEERTAVSAERARGARIVYWVIGLSGACALGAEVVWTRLLSLMIGGTVYTFSMILAVFLSGLGIGSWVGALLGRATKRPRVLLGWCQFAQTAAIAWAALLIAKAFPNWPINPSLAPSPWFTFQLDLTRVIWVVFPAALLWGASFPLALTVASERGQEPARLVGGIYAANTIGAILGSLGFSLLFIPMIGTQGAQRLLIALAGIAGVAMFISILVQQDSARKTEVSPASALLQLNIGGILGLLLLIATPAIPALLVAYGRYAVTWINQIDVKYVGEGRNSSIAVSTLKSSGATQFHVAGKVEASSLPQDMRLQRMLGHLPALVHPNPRSVLIVGFGAGVTAGSFVPYPDINRIVICEIEPLIPHKVSEYFTRENNNVMNDPRVQVIYDDARSVILTTDEKFDIITSDPIHPWVKGAASLYTKEYFEAVKKHLNPGGVVSQWVPLYESNAATVKSEIATFFEVFPNGTVWANNKDGSGYDVVLLGQVGPTVIDLNTLAQRMSNPGYVPVIASLNDVNFTSPVDLFSTYAGRASELKPWLQDAVINRDRNLRLQYLAATGLNEYNSAPIFSELVGYRRWPEDIFRGPDAWISQLRELITIGR